MKKIRRREILHSFYSPEHPPFIQELLKKRSIESPEDFDLTLHGLLPFHTLLNIEKATALLVEAIVEQKDVLIVGDYDVDGATSIALAVRVLRDFGLHNVRYRVPHRVLDGYGLTRTLVHKITDNPPDLLITVDNGISNIEGVALAKEHGIQVIITDHHLPPETLPEADAIVNPQLVGDPFPSKNLAGVGVIFYLLLSVRAALAERNYFVSRGPNLAKYLDIVALGTVADIVPLDANNRKMVQQGLLRIRQGVTISGIQAMVEVSRRDRAKLSTADIGYGIAPLLNAAGRIDDMEIGIKALLTDDEMEARAIATKLYELNQARREIESDTRIEADAILETLKLEIEELPPAICLYDEAWHQGVTGIVASRIKDQYYRPTFIFAYDNEGLIKGSGRSIEGIHLRDMLSNVAQKYEGLIQTFGGHAMAAGLSLYEEDLPQFYEAIALEIEAHTEPTAFDQVIYTDGELPVSAFNLQYAEFLRLAIPWGQHFPEPLFDGVFKVINYRILKDQHLKLTLQYPNLSYILDGIAFFQARQLIDNVEKIHCAYKLDVNEWQGRRNLQLIIDHFEPL